MLDDALNRFRLIAFLEGLSFLVLLGIAMPLKYLADMPMAVRYVGWAHGVLFIAYVMALVHVSIERRWSAPFSGVAFLASLVPGGTFVLERRIRPERPLPPPT